MENKNCAKCGSTFTVEDRDLKFYNKVSPVFNGKKYLVTPPTFCPDCRQQRRLAWRGKDYFFRDCGFDGNKHLSIYPPDIDMVTYCPEHFHGDGWDGLDFGRDYDFNRPFFDQFIELWYATPKNIANAKMNDNCEYIINAHKNKDCYLLDEVDESRDCLYGYNIQHCEDVVNGFYVNKSKLSYEIAHADNCYEVFFSRNVYDSANSAFLENCRNVRNSMFCANLRNAEYMVFNKKVTPEEYRQLWAKIFSGSQNVIEDAKSKYRDFLQTQPMPPSIMINTEGSTGDQQFNTKDCTDSYNIDNCRDCRFCFDIHYSKDCYDVNIYMGELMYECLHAGPEGRMQVFSHLPWFCSDVYYCSEVHNSKYLFGCSGLKRKEYCILNKQYTKEEYEELVPRIIEHMKLTGEWGEYFPAKLSSYGYNQTFASYYFPLSKEEAQSKGFNWAKDIDQFPDASGIQPPENLADMTEAMTSQVFSSKQSGKKYKITAQELKFHKRYNIALPTIAPDERVFQFTQQNVRKLWDRQCHKCNSDIQTTYSPERHSMIYCEKCYLETIY